MELIKTDKVLKYIEELGVDSVNKDLIINNVSLYNNLVLDYTLSGIDKNLNLIYQLSILISKHIADLKKQNPKPTEEEGGIMDLVKKLKEPKAAK